MGFENYPTNPAIFSSNENRHFAITDYEVVDEPHVKYGIMCFPEERLTIKFGYDRTVYEAENTGNIKSHPWVNQHDSSKSNTNNL